MGRTKRDAAAAPAKAAPKKPAANDIQVWMITGTEAIPASCANREVGPCCPAITEITNPVEAQEGDTEEVSTVDVALKALELLPSKVNKYLDDHKRSFDPRLLNQAATLPLIKIFKHFSASPSGEFSTIDMGNQKYTNCHPSKVERVVWNDVAPGENMLEISNQVDRSGILPQYTGVLGTAHPRGTWSRMTSQYPYVPMTFLEPVADVKAWMNISQEDPDPGMGILQDPDGVLVRIHPHGAKPRERCMDKDSSGDCVSG